VIYFLRKLEKRGKFIKRKLTGGWFIMVRGRVAEKGGWSISKIEKKKQGKGATL